MVDYINREIFPILFESMSEPFISVIIGPRQTGKTTIINKLITELKSRGILEKNILFYNFDQAELKNSLKSNPDNLIKKIESSLSQTLSSVREKTYLFFDEAQKIPEAFDAIKIIHDEYKQFFKIVISGSSSLNLYQRSAESLAGRVRFYYLSTLRWRELARHYFSLKENLSLISIFLKNGLTYEKYLELQQPLHKEKNNAQLIWNNYLLNGGLPEIFLMKKTGKKELALRDYIATYLEKDIRYLHTIKDADVFSSTLNFFLLNDTKLVNLSALSTDTSIQRLTLKKYLQILEDTFLVKQLSPFTKISRQAVKSPKLYFFDHGLINYQKKIYSLEQLVISENMGIVFESIIINNLLSHFANDPMPPWINFWRDYQDHEIDLVVSWPEKIVPIEITCATKINKQKIFNFKAFYKAYPQADNGLIVYQGDFQELEISGKKILAIPHWMWF